MPDNTHKLDPFSAGYLRHCYKQGLDEASAFTGLVKAAAQHIQAGNPVPGSLQSYFTQMGLACAQQVPTKRSQP